MERKLQVFLSGIYITIVLILLAHVQGENVALNKPATQLGIWGSHRADRAVDGNTDQRLGQGSCAHPDSLDNSVDEQFRGDPAWWSVDLSNGDPSQTYIIDNITIYFRRCCEDRVEDNLILVGTDRSNLKQCTEITSREYIQTVTCASTEPVRYVTIQHKSLTVLGICEVIVNGYLNTGSIPSTTSSTTTTTAPTPAPTTTTTTTTTTTIPTTTTTTPTTTTRRPTTTTTKPTTTTTTTTKATTTTQTTSTTTTPTPTPAPTPAPTLTPIPTLAPIPTPPPTRTPTPTLTSPQTSPKPSTNTPPPVNVITPKPTAIPTPKHQPPPVDETAKNGGNGTKKSGGSTGMIAGVIVAILLIIIIVAVVAFILVRRSRAGKSVPGRSNLIGVIPGWNKKKPVPPSSAPPDEEQIIGSDEETPPPSPPPSLPPSASAGPKKDDATKLPPQPPVKVENLGQYIKDRKQEAEPYRAEFKGLQNGKHADWQVGDRVANRNKNRFLNIRAYEHSRVSLDIDDGDPNSDYINANYLSGYGGVEKVYVAAQGPMKDTIADTWRMVWQTNSNRIIMATNLVEGGKLKCEQYWPDFGSAMYGKVKVNFVSLDDYAAYIIRVFKVEHEGESRTVRQFHFTSWPDHGVPTVATDLLEFRRRVNMFDKDATGPLIIHCSAGVGRTGTYIAVDIGIQQGQTEKEVNVWGITYQMRTDRVNMIQTLDQYIFVHDALHEALLSGETAIPAVDFREEYAKLCEDEPQSLLAKQFETLEVFKTSQEGETNLIALEAGNIDKNRNKEVVPSNRYRPFLSTPVDGTTSYINAVYADSFRAKLDYIITQMPLSNTVADFWRLIYDHHSTTIIMLNPLNADDDDTGVYWPEAKDQSLTFGPLEVKMTSVDTEHPHITTRDFKITNDGSKRVATVRQFQLTSWISEQAYRDVRGVLLEVIDMVEQWQKEAEKGTTTIHCIDGVTRCGLFVSSLYAVEQLKVDQVVDVFRAVKQVRIPRPQFIQDIDQYKFVHEMVLAHLEEPEGQ